MTKEAKPKKPVWYKVACHGHGAGWYEVGYLLSTPTCIEDDADELGRQWTQYSDGAHGYTLTWKKVAGKIPTISEALAKFNKAAKAKRRADENYDDSRAFLLALRHARKM